MSKICFRCGGSVEENDRFCRACGAPLTEDTAPNEDVDVFVLKPGSARLEIEETPPPSPPPQEEPQSSVVEKAPQPESSEPAAPVHMSWREKRIAKKIQQVESEEDDEDYVYPEQPAKKRWGLKAKFISLLVVLLLIAALVGALYLHQTIQRAAFAPVEAAYASLSDDTSTSLKDVFYPELYTYMTEDGYFSENGIWTEEIGNWQTVYGRSFTAAPKLNASFMLFGEEREAFLKTLETNYSISAFPLLLMELDYTVSIKAELADASIHKSTFVGFFGNNWYILQEDF